MEVELLPRSVPGTLVIFVIAHFKKGPMHGQNGGGTVYRESSSTAEGGRLRRQDKAQRQSLMSRARGDLAVGVVQIQTAVFGEVVDQSWETQERRLFRPTKDCGTQIRPSPWNGECQVSRSLPETRIAERAKTHGTAARCRPG
jgi:hypothetical protein